MHYTMTSSKSVPISFRMTPETKELLALCAQHEHRSMASMVEYMVYSYAAAQGITLPVTNMAKNRTKKS